MRILQLHQLQKATEKGKISVKECTFIYTILTFPSKRIETVLQQKKPSRNTANIPNINARLEYTALPKLDPDLPRPELTEDNSHLSGNSKIFYIFYLFTS